MYTGAAFKTWLAERGHSYTWAAEQLGTSRQQVYRWANGVCLPGVQHLRLIFLVSGGAITPSDFFPGAEWRAELAARPEDAA